MRWILTVAILSYGNYSLAQNAGLGETPTTPSPSPSYAPSPSPSSINSDAKKGQNTQMIGMILNGAAAAYFASQCPENTPSCMMALMALSSALQMKGAADQSGRTYDATLNYPPPGSPGPGPGPGGGPPPDYVPGDLPPGVLPPGADRDFRRMGSEGWTMHNGKVFGPDGKEYTPDDTKSEAALINAGFSPSQASGAMSKLGKVNAMLAEKAKQLGADDPHLISMGVDGGGGGGASRSPASEDGLDDYLKRLRNPFGLNGKQKGAMVAGKSLAHGDDQVGVKQDNIFQMMNRAYQSRRDDDQFIEPAMKTAAPSGKSLAPQPRSSRK